ncbi:hypothetical protein [Polynucleobacter sp. AP-Latsch-80-C2]|jgi:hypothetical protein|uniref:hypothetical protein n=1 Tax=Polynucleobacter sp. AP-Latsch-80-C2 TaxID=2576931 RepID=UPI001C0DD262|nr:hypothetical protein [Polynucleobacter sp. AP-Latsch-80-C2]MBU3624159.1 hypothetical protein [Polynucleobacter sp. AP-Latsch-80-C2]
MKFFAYSPYLALAICLVISACSVAKLEARLEADPQCKPIINPKTGALLPCPGSDKAFYVAAGLTPAKVEAPKNIDPRELTSTTATISPATYQNAGSSSSAECKTKIHQKTGGILPCPSD